MGGSLVRRAAPRRWIPLGDRTHVGWPRDVGEFRKRGSVKSGSMLTALAGGLIGYVAAWALSRQPAPLEVPEGFGFTGSVGPGEHPENGDAKPVARVVFELDNRQNVHVQWDCDEQVSPLKVIPMAMQMHKIGG